MTARLYRTTRALHAAVVQALDALPLAAVGTPTTVALIALYVTGLILLDTRQTQTRVTRHLPGRCHDALNRLLRTMPLSTQAALGGLGLRPRQEAPGLGAAYRRPGLVRPRWALAPPGRLRLWRPKRSCTTHDYHTKPELAAAMLKGVIGAGLRADFLAFDTHYTAGWCTKLAARLGLTWHGTRGPRTAVVYRGWRGPASELAPRLRLRWRAHLGLRAGAATVYAPT